MAGSASRQIRTVLRHLYMCDKTKTELKQTKTIRCFSFIIVFVRSIVRRRCTYDPISYCLRFLRYHNIIYTSTGGHPFKLYKTRSSTSTRANFFSERIINVWNALPTDVVDFNSLSKFRSSVLKVDLSGYTKHL